MKYNPVVANYTFPTVFSLLWFYLGELDRMFDFVYVLLIPILICICALSILLIIYIITTVAQGKWHQFISILIGLSLGASLLFSLKELGADPKWVTFQFKKSDYMSQVALLRHTDDKPRLKLWDWGESGGAGVGTCFYTLVFDENDEITLPKNKRSKKWVQCANQLRKENTKYMFENVEIGDEGSSIKNFGNHFFMVVVCF
jgi:hypothetical protein